MKNSVAMDQFLIDLGDAVELETIESPFYVALGDHLFIFCKIEAD